MEELIIVMVIKFCNFDNSTIDKEVRLACAEDIVNCMVGKSQEQAVKCLDNKRIEVVNEVRN